MKDDKLRQLVRDVLTAAIKAKRDGYWSKETQAVVDLVSAVEAIESHLLNSAVDAFVGRDKEPMRGDK